MDPIAETFAQLPPEDLLSVWSWIDFVEQSGEISPPEAMRWKHAIFSVMLARGLGPHDLTSTN